MSELQVVQKQDMTPEAVDLITNTIAKGASKTDVKSL